MHEDSDSDADEHSGRDADGYTDESDRERSPPSEETSESGMTAPGPGPGPDTDTDEPPARHEYDGTTPPLSIESSVDSETGDIETAVQDRPFSTRIRDRLEQLLSRGSSDSGSEPESTSSSDSATAGTPSADVGWLDRFAYRQFSPYFRAHRDRFSDFRQTVNKARLEDSYDRYLARALLHTLLISGFGLLVGVVLGVALAGSGVFEMIETQVRMPAGLATFVTTYKNLLGLLVTATLVTAFVAVPTAMAYYYLPTYYAYERERYIDLLLPQATTYMFAMSRGGMTIVSIVRQLASDTDTYGEVAESFESVVADMDYFGSDLRSAMREARETTPSDDLAELYDDMIALIESGGSLTPFLKNKTERYRQEADQRKEDILDLLELVAEMYVISMVVGVLLLITIFIIMTSISGGGLLRLYLIIYLGLPLGSAAFILTVDAVTADDTKTTATLPAEVSRPSVDDLQSLLEENVESTSPKGDTQSATPDGGHTPDTPGKMETELTREERAGLEQLLRAKKRTQWRETLEAPLERMRRDPAFSLVVSIPIALGVLLTFALTGIAVPTPSAFLTQPVWTTTFAVVVPAAFVLAPLSYFYERERYHQRRVNRELPQVLKKVASANETGMTLGRSLALVGHSSEGYLARELRRVDRELSEWNVSSEEALIRFANRVRNPRLTRVVKLLTEAASSSSNVREILDVAAADVEVAHDIDRDRLRRMTFYLFFMLLGNLVFLGIIVMLQTRLLPQMAAATGGTDPVGLDAQLSVFAGLNLSEIRMLFFHAVLLQAFFSGLAGGKFGEGSVYAGAKYSLAQLLLAVAVFWLI